jgi:hypothetical protein
MARDVLPKVPRDDPRVEVGAAADIEALDQIDVAAAVERGGIARVG